MSEPKTIERDLIGDWYLFGGMVIAALNDSGIRWRHAPLNANQPIGVRIFAGSALSPVATIEISGVGAAHLAIRPAPGNEAGMLRMANVLSETSAQADDMRRAWTPNADELIRRYYRARAASKGRVTLKQIAEEAGISYSWLRQRKMAYDRAGKWGAGQTKPNKKADE